jgi:vacuolar-type H+-ATPase subunit I/STV1
MLQQIAASYTIAAQTARIEQFKSELLKLERSPNDHRELVDYHDESSLLHMNHIDVVKAGRWQSELSATEVRVIEDFVNHWCDRSQYETSLFLRKSEAQISGVK